MDLNGYLETVDLLKRAVSQLDPNRESFNDLLSIMTKRRESMGVSMQGAGYESEVQAKGRGSMSTLQMS